MNTKAADMLFFDTLAYAKKLKKAGFTDEQAEVQSEALAGVLENNMATKLDIRNLEHHIVDVKRDMVGMKQELEQKIETLSYKLTIRLGSMLVVAVGLLGSLQVFSQ